MRSSMYASRSRCSGASHVASRASGWRVRGLRMARTLPVAPRLVLRAWSAARCSRADGRTCQSTRASAGTRVISPVWPAAGPSRVAVCSDRGEFAKPKSGIGPPYCGAWNGLRSLAILPSQTTISPEARGGGYERGCQRELCAGRLVYAELHPLRHARGGLSGVGRPGAAGAAGRGSGSGCGRSERRTDIHSTDKPQRRETGFATPSRVRICISYIAIRSLYSSLY